MVIKKKTVSDQHFKSQNFNFIALLFVFLFFTLSLELLNGLRSSVGLTQRIPPFGDKLRHGLILWPKLAASSNTVSEKWRQQRFNRRFALHLRADSHHDREIYKKIKIMYFTVSWPSDFSTLLTSDNMACSLNVPVSKSKKNKASIHSHCQTYRDARKE